jgi:hypothetical protein
MKIVCIVMPYRDVRVYEITRFRAEIRDIKVLLCIKGVLLSAWSFTAASAPVMGAAGVGRLRYIEVGHFVLCMLGVCCVKAITLWFRKCGW